MSDSGAEDAGLALDQALKDLGEQLRDAMPEAIEAIEAEHGEMIVRTNVGAVLRLLTYLRDHPSVLFTCLVDITAVDWPEDEERFEIVYNLLSVTQNLRLRVTLRTDEATPVPSAVKVFSSADWLEREVWDLYGVFFSDHPDLRRILTDYGFEGHPLRKDFPMTGYVEVRYDEEQKRVVYEPVSLTQEFRYFDFESPWEGMLQAKSNALLPGDEKAGDQGKS